VGKDAWGTMLWGGCSLRPHLCKPLHSLLKSVCVVTTILWSEYVGNYTFGKLWANPNGSQIPWHWTPWIVQSGWLCCWKKY